MHGQRKRKFRNITYGVKVNHLSKSVSESELESAFHKYGTLASIRLRSGDTENYAFINYSSPIDAQAAADDMNGKCFAGVQISVKVQDQWASSCFSSSSGEYTVKVTSLSKHTTEDTLKGIFCFSPGVVVLSVKVNQTDGVFNYAYVNYDNPSDAEQAEKQLDGLRIDGKIVKVKLHSSGKATASSPLPYGQCTPPYGRCSPTYDQCTPPYGRCSPTYGRCTPPYGRQTPPLDSSLPHGRHTPPLNLPLPHELYAPPFGSSLPHGRRIPPFFPTRPEKISPWECHQHLSGYPTAPFFSPAKPSTSHFQLQLQKEVYTPQRPAPSQAFAPICLQSKSVKVSIHGDLTGEKIEEIFSQFGEISEKPIVRSGTPNYAYVNFQSPEVAHAACKLDDTLIKGTRVHVKVTEKKVGGGSSTQECKPIACDSLLAKLLASEKYHYQLEKIYQTQQVRVKRMKSGNGFNLWGDPTNIAAAENCIRLLADKVMAEIDQQSFSLPCLVVPLLQNQEMLKQAALIEEKYGVEFCLIDQSTQCPLGIAEFGRKVSDVFSSTTEIPGVSSFSKYMTSTSSTTPSAAINTEYVWLWEDDKGGYTPYSPEMCTTFSKVFAVSPRCQFQCKVPTKQGITNYMINFVNMTQRNNKSGNQRSIKRQICTPTWHYQDDHKQFTPYNSQDSAEIEKMYKSRNTSMFTINGTLYTFDFDNMEQINVATKHTSPIQRQLAPNKDATLTTEPDRELSFQVRGLKPNLHVAVKEFENELMVDVVPVSHQLPLGSCYHLRVMKHFSYHSCKPLANILWLKT